MASLTLEQEMAETANKLDMTARLFLKNSYCCRNTFRKLGRDIILLKNPVLNILLHNIMLSSPAIFWELKVHLFFLIKLYFNNDILILLADILFSPGTFSC